MCCYYFPVVLLKRSAIIPCFCQKIDVTIPLFCQKRGRHFYAVLSKGYAIILFFLQNFWHYYGWKAPFSAQDLNSRIFVHESYCRLPQSIFATWGGYLNTTRNFRSYLVLNSQCSLKQVSIINSAISTSVIFIYNLAQLESDWSI